VPLRSVLAATLGVLAAVGRAAGDEPKSVETAPEKETTELNFLPLIGGDSDTGIGAGVVGDLAHLSPSYKPYRWRLEAGAFITFKPGDNGDAIQSPYQDFYLDLILPQLTESRRLRLEVRPSFTTETTQRFDGLGNDSPEPPSSLPPRASQYGRRRLALDTAARVDVGNHLFVRGSIGYSRFWLDVASDSILAQERTTGSDEVRKLLAAPDHFGVLSTMLALEYDTRENEIVTHDGSFHQLRLRFSPSFGDDHPFRFGQINSTFRFYRSPAPWLVLGARILGDVIFGDAPFYELTRIDELSMFGGATGIRGVPGQRYYGKVKVIGNLEGRAEMWHFELFGKDLVLAGALFVDAGRVWVDLEDNPALDGTGLGLKLGLGGGLRLQEGKTFVVRGDLAWSPDARPIGAYVSAGEIF
jgi:Omp85 superfamily domain